MKVTVEIEQLSDVAKLIETIDGHKMGTVLVVIAVVVLAGAFVGGYWVLRQ